MSELDNSGLFIEDEVRRGLWRYCYCGRVTKADYDDSCSICRRTNYGCRKATLQEARELGVTRKDLGRYDGEWLPWLTDVVLLAALGLLYVVRVYVTAGGG